MIISPPIPERKNDASRTTEDDLRWMTDWGFDFVRLPIAYPRYLKFDRSKQITKDDFYRIDEKVVGEIEQLVFMAQKYNLHVSRESASCSGVLHQCGIL